MTDPRLIALSSNPGQVEPGPFSEDDLRKQWNAQADEFNQWDSLDFSEQLAWAQNRAITWVCFPRLEPTAFELGELPPPAAAKPVNLAELRDPDFSDGLTASQHLNVLRGGPDPRAAATALPGLPPRVGHILRLAEIIREVDGNHDLGAAALAEAILAHPGFSGCHDGSVASAAQGVLDVRYEFSVFDSEDCEQAGGSAPTLDDAIREGRNYLSQYNQDGPHKLELRRVLVLDYSESANA
jgi:hypothetical protein